MDDIVSYLCDLPTGLFDLEFLPRHEIAVWEGSIPIPRYRWYGIGVYRNSLTFGQPTEESVQGDITPMSVGCLVVNDSQAIADQLHAMGQMRFVLRVTHYDGKRRIIGAPEEYVSLKTSEYNPTEIVGAQGYKLNFAGVLNRRPVVIN